MSNDTPKEVKERWEEIEEHCRPLSINDQIIYLTQIIAQLSAEVWLEDHMRKQAGRLNK